MGESEISQYLSYLASQRKVAASTQNQALCALVLLYKQVLKVDLGDFGPMERAKKPERLPTGLTPDEVSRVLSKMSGTHALMAKLLYGTGIRLMECLRLRVMDIDFARSQVMVRQGKGMRVIRDAHEIMRFSHNIIQKRIISWACPYPLLSLFFGRTRSKMSHCFPRLHSWKSLIL